MIGLALAADLSVDVVRSAVESLADARIVARSTDFVRDGVAMAGRLHRHHPRISEKREPPTLRVGAAPLLKPAVALTVSQCVGRQAVDFGQ